MDTFGTWLLAELNRRKISQSELARLSGLAPGTISNIITGKRGRGADSLTAIAQALKLPPDVVFREAGILPENGDADVMTEAILHRAKDLNDEERNMVLEFIDMLDRARKRKGKR